MEQYIRDAFKTFTKNIGKVIPGDGDYTLRHGRLTLVAYDSFLRRFLPVFISAVRGIAREPSTKDTLKRYHGITCDNLNNLSTTVGEVLVVTQRPDMSTFVHTALQREMQRAWNFVDEMVYNTPRSRHDFFLLALFEAVQHRFADFFLQMCDYRFDIDSTCFCNLKYRPEVFDFQKVLLDTSIAEYDSWLREMGERKFAEQTSKDTIDRYVSEMAKAVQSIFSFVSIVPSR